MGRRAVDGGTAVSNENPEAVPPKTEGAGENICRKCAGTGKIEGEQCPDCKGTGKVVTPLGGA